MRGTAISDVLKVWLYAVASVWIGVWMSPLVYNAGKAVDEVGSVKQTNAVFKWLAALCDKADFPVFFQTSLILTALVLFIPFIDWVRGGRFAKEGKILKLLVPADETDAGGIHRNPRGFLQATLGFGMITGLLLVLTGLLLATGVLARSHPPGSIPVWILTSFGIAVAFAAIQEILFRGIALGVFLRAMPPPYAIGLTALLFAGVHFLHPPAGMNVADPELPGVGFELLGKLASQFLQPRALLANFAPLLVLGGLLGWARWRTRSLFLPIGLHAGWWFAGSLATGFTTLSRRTTVVQWLVSPDSPRQGLIALAVLVATSYLILRFHRHAAEATT